MFVFIQPEMKHPVYQILGLGKSFLNQTTYVLKNPLWQQSFLNQDRVFLNWECTAPNFLWCIKIITFGNDLLKNFELAKSSRVQSMISSST